MSQKEKPASLVYIIILAILGIALISVMFLQIKSQGGFYLDNDFIDGTLAWAALVFFGAVMLGGLWGAIRSRKKQK